MGRLAGILPLTSLPQRLHEPPRVPVPLPSLTGNGSSLSPPQGLHQEVTDLRFRVTDIETERLQCEEKLAVTQVSGAEAAARGSEPTLETLHYMFKTL